MISSINLLQDKVYLNEISRSLLSVLFDDDDDDDDKIKQKQQQKTGTKSYSSV